ncbi:MULTISPECIES: glutathione peroxidase [Chryseobacterium]|uniref:Glutathione peroxidase n=1 Tax=Chryseobacterium camelliae TaxID=1265445 RepID=A0ABU0TJD2_9FLAO|nr:MULTISPECIES: glutathione peroxidase [Chryseobacterium]MDT3405893.1 glutathione peroxidase [Pseudacidovorax intermedius]MDQ1096303.1 glutathione peroxidase [Chryseobacterium camelliae]MDQ1100242.1 glutathione peroxidase [Chryseobacterium sp. SORGH_AS_1048]MDR6087585.1 glutathione peroxidase [Chryseobacterium sp. SORGH_AS_0909]MDR6131959.1 glutathione peroxidase [Chryseobacterium sp. SORGH_AS_1175]
MKKIFLLLLSFMAFFNSCAQKKSEASKTKTKALMGKTIYDYKVESLDGKEINFADFKGKKILVVNTASQCGFTPQYADLEKLYEEYKDKLVIVGFPANNFGGQEPGTNTEIGAFCQKNYGVTFPMAAKVSVKGDDTAPIFKYLTEKELNGVKNTTILWNFTKFLIDENGKLIDSFVSTTKPTDEAITKYLK